MKGATQKHLTDDSITIPLFPELRGYFDDQLAVPCVRVHGTHCGSVGAGEIVEVPPVWTRSKHSLLFFKYAVDDNHSHPLRWTQILM